MHQTLKFLLGIDQAWVNVELCLSIKYNIIKTILAMIPTLIVIIMH